MLVSSRNNDDSYNHYAGQSEDEWSFIELLCWPVQGLMMIYRTTMLASPRRNNDSYNYYADQS